MAKGSRNRPVAYHAGYKATAMSENVRRARNGWMRELWTVTMSDASKAIEVASDIFESVYDF